MSFKVSSYRWIPDLPDHRDHLYAAPAEVAGALPASFGLRAQCLSVYDRGQIGSCTANAIAGPIQSGQMKQKLAQIFTRARLALRLCDRANPASDFWTIRMVQ